MMKLDGPSITISLKHTKIFIYTIKVVIIKVM